MNKQDNDLLIITIIDFFSGRAFADMRISKRHVVVAQHFRGFDKQYILVEVRFNFTETFAFALETGIIVPALIGLA